MSLHRPTLRALGAAAGVVVLAALVALGVVIATRPDVVDAAPVQPTPSPSGPTSLTAAQIYDLVLPSIVLIRSEASGEKGSGSRASGLGTGTVVSRDGTILTAAHVVGNAGSVHVEFTDGTETTAQVLTADEATDIAMLSPDRLPEVVVPAVIGGGTEVGDRVVAIGHPLGLVATTTEGIVSGLGRSVTVKNGAKLQGLIQFDAAVNPGSSGGPLLGDRGEVLGVVSALANPTQDGYFIGIGFAVPIGQALGVGLGGEEPER